MALPQLHSEELSILELLEQTSVDGGEFYAVGNTQGLSSFVERDDNLASIWHNAPSLDGFAHQDIQEQSEMFSDTESLASCGTAVASPAVFDYNTEQNHFNFLQDHELKQLSVKELNLKLKGHPKELVNSIKRRRRTLKNRGYAHSCRIKRLQEKSKLQRSQAELEEHIAELQRELTAAKDERDLYKSRYETLVRRIVATQNKNA